MTSLAQGVLARVPRIYVVGLFCCFAESATVFVHVSSAASRTEASSVAGLAFAGSQLGVLVAAWILAAAIDLALRAFGLLRASELLGPGRLDASDAFAGALIALPIALVANAYAASVSLREFKNQDLIVALLAVVTLSTSVLGLLLWAVAAAGARAFRDRPGRSSSGKVVIFAPGTLLVAVLLAGFVFTNRSGLAQLDALLWAAPVLGVLGVALTATPGVRASLARKGVTLGIVAGSLVVGLVASFGTTSPSAVLARYGAWSRPLITILRVVTDFDRDGYSAWFAGGDCRAFDARVHPGAPEVPGDGIDNNCLGGDGRGDELIPPRPSEIAARPWPARPNLVVVTIETLRADRVSFSGYSRPTTPRLDELARTSAVFERAYAPTPTTRLSLPSLFSGLLPSKIGWIPQAYRKQMRHIDPKTPWLPELLRAHGYATLAVHADFRAFTQVESAGFERGFQRYDTSTHLEYTGGTMHGFPGEQQIERALALLDQIPERPFLLWVHLLEPHYLYEQSPRVRHFGDDEQALYAADIAEADHQVGRLVDGLVARNVFENSLFFVSGDHGEEFGEHGQRWHGSNLYEAQIRTPVLFRIPGLPARRIRDVVTLTDFVPTVLDLVGIRTGFEGLQGRNLLPLLTSGKTPLPGIFIENFTVDTGQKYMLGLVDWPYKLIYTEEGRTLELYDLVRDPEERLNLYTPDDSRAHALADRLYQYLESSARAHNP